MKWYFISVVLKRWPQLFLRCRAPRWHLATDAPVAGSFHLPAWVSLCQGMNRLDPWGIPASNGPTSKGSNPVLWRLRQRVSHSRPAWRFRSWIQCHISFAVQGTWHTSIVSWIYELFGVSTISVIVQTSTSTAWKAMVFPKSQSSIRPGDDSDWGKAYVVNNCFKRSRNPVFALEMIQTGTSARAGTRTGKKVAIQYSPWRWFRPSANFVRIVALKEVAIQYSPWRWFRRRSYKDQWKRPSAPVAIQYSPWRWFRPQYVVATA